MAEKHLSSQFDNELNAISTKVMEMGGLLEQQVRQAILALSRFSVEIADEVIQNEEKLNALEVEVDHDVSSIIGRRQPTARDLRLLIAISKITGNLERAGDEAKKIARMIKRIMANGGGRSLPTSELYVAADMASNLIRQALDAFARLDAQAAMDTIRGDDVIDKEFDNFLRILITYMMEDPRQISPSLDLLFLAKAIERIGDHAKNVAEQVIYIVDGADIRHQKLEQSSTS